MVSPFRGWTVAVGYRWASKLLSSDPKRARSICPGARAMTVSLVVPQAIFEELSLVAALPEETAGVMLAGVAEAPNSDVRLLVRGMRWVGESAYSRRQWNGLTIRPEGYVPALSEAETIGAMCIWVHTHPGMGASPEASEHDRIVDQEIADLFR